MGEESTGISIKKSLFQCKIDKNNLSSCFHQDIKSDLLWCNHVTDEVLKGLHPLILLLWKYSNVAMLNLVYPQVFLSIKK